MAFTLIDFGIARLASDEERGRQFRSSGDHRCPLICERRRFVDDQRAVEVLVLVDIADIGADIGLVLNAVLAARSGGRRP